MALLRLVSPSTGSILVDGIDISAIRPEVLRRRLIAVPQDTFTMKGTIRSNLDPFGENSDTDIISIAKELHVWTALENRGGLEATLLNQPLSQGEQQLLCLARAMLRKSKVLIFDEATSSLDGETNRLVQNVVNEKFADCTVICVAHRVSGHFVVQQAVLFLSSLRWRLRITRHEFRANNEEFLACKAREENLLLYHDLSNET